MVKLCRSTFDVSVSYLFQSFSKEQVLEFVNLPRFTVYLHLRTFDDDLKRKREGFVSLPGF
jgi:hypothetical protein